MAAPRVWLFPLKTIIKLKINESHEARTVKPAMETVSVYCSPLTEVSSLNEIVKGFPRSWAEELALGSYVRCPAQDLPHLESGRNKSCFLYRSRLHESLAVHPNERSRGERTLPVKLFAGVPTEMTPHQCALSLSVSGMLPESRFCNGLITSASGWAAPVLRAKASSPLWILLCGHSLWMQQNRVQHAQLTRLSYVYPSSEPRGSPYHPGGKPLHAGREEWVSHRPIAALLLEQRK